MAQINLFNQLKTHRYHTCLILLILVAVITHWRWFFINAMFGWGDFSLPLQFKDTWLKIYDLPYMWSSLFNEYGGVNISLSSFMLNFLTYCLIRIGFDSNIVTRIVYLLPSPLLALFGAFHLVRYFTKNSLAGFVGAIVFSLNAYLIALEAGAVNGALAFAFTPYVLLYFAKTLESKKIVYAIFTGLCCFIYSSYEFRFFYILTHILFLYLLFKMFALDYSLSLKLKLKNIIYAAIPFLIVGILNLYWILPYLLSGSLFSNEVFNRGLFGNSYMSLVRSLAMSYPWWTGGRDYAIFELQPIPLQFWLIPIFVLLSFILNSKKKITYFFALISLLGIFLTKQSDIPFPSLYLWLFQHYPGFNAFREASKFYVVLALGYSFIIGQLFAALKNKYLKLVLSLVITSVFLWNTTSLISGQYGAMYVPRYLPPAYLQVKDFLLADQNYSRTLWVPAASVWTYTDLVHPKNSLHNSYMSKWTYILPKGPGYQSLENKSTSISNINHQVLTVFNQTYSQNFLSLLAIKYIFVPLEDTKNDNNVFKNTGVTDRDYVIKILDNTDFLRKINIGTPEIEVYENTHYKPHLYLSDAIESIFIPTNSIKVPFTQVNPTQYHLKLSNITKPVFLNFSESFDPSWNLYLGSFNPFKVLHDRSSLYSGEFHQKNDAAFNSFIIDPTYIESFYSTKDYQKNPDGSINIDLTLYYLPQSYVYLGIIITAVIFVAFTIWFFVRKH